MPSIYKKITDLPPGTQVYGTNRLEMVHNPGGPDEESQQITIDQVTSSLYSVFLPITGGSLTGDLAIGRDLSIIRNFFIGGNTVANGNLDVNGQLTVVQDIFLDGNISIAGGGNINGLGDPVDAHDASNKSYVDSVAAILAGQFASYLPLAGGLLTGDVSGPSFTGVLKTTSIIHTGLTIDAPPVSGGNGYSVFVKGGVSSTAFGGGAALLGGNGSTAGGAAFLQGGNAPTANGSQIILFGGAGTEGGSINLNPGVGSGANGAINFSGDVLPASDNTHSLGSPTKSVKNGYFASTVFAKTISASGTISGNGSGLTNVSGTVPSGVIVMWHGSIATVPSGWALCNGSNGTPDLRNRFIVGAAVDVGGISKTTINIEAEKTGGDTMHTHAVDDPGHTHFIGDSWSSNGSGGGPGINSDESSTTTGVSATDLSIVEGTNVPPFFALAYIMKL